MCLWKKDKKQNRVVEFRDMCIKCGATEVQFNIDWSQENSI